MVAKTYQTWEMPDKPFTVGGKAYIMARNPKTGTSKQVRWYTDWEYARMYPEAKSKTEASVDKSRKHALGFDNGYITIFKGDTYPHLDWFRASPARYARVWGWYIISTIEMPADLPLDIEPVRLEWTEVSENDILLSEDKIKNIVESKLFDSGTSEHFGTVGTRYDLNLLCTKVIDLESYYGKSYLHTFEDENGNVFTWTTAATHLEEDTMYFVRGTVKQHTTYRNVKQTQLTRCKCTEA